MKLNKDKFLKTEVGSSMKECCISGQQVFVLFKVKSADTVGTIAGKGVVIDMIAPCVAQKRRRRRKEKQEERKWRD